MTTNPRDKTIIFFSLYYPFHFSDSYLDEEINGLSQRVDKMIVISADTRHTERRCTPTNAIVYRYAPVTNVLIRIKAFQLFFKPMLYFELHEIVFKQRRVISFGLLKELFAFYTRAIATKQFLDKVIKSEKINVSHLLIYSYWMIESSMAAILVKKAVPAIKVICRAHSQDVYFERSPVKYQFFRKYIFNHLNHLYFISGNAMEYFCEKHQLSTFDKKKVSVNRIGIAANRSFIDKINSDTIRIISVAYIQMIKRIDLIIDTLSLITDIKIEWIHVGHVHNSEEGFNKIKEYADQKLTLNENIRFSFKGQTEKCELFKLYDQKKFDFFLNVSQTEGIPVSMMEAMSYSVPVIGTNVGGVAEIIEDGRNGFLLPPYPNAEKVKQEILRYYLLEPEARSNMRKEAFNTWNKKYNAEKNYKQFIEEASSFL